MAAEEPTTSPQPRRLAPPEPDLEPVSATEPALERRDQPARVLDQPGGAIATLEAPPVPVIGVPDDPRTGEPRVPRTVVLASVLSFLSVANVVAGLLLVYWDAVPRDNFPNASWLMGQFVTEPGSTGRVLLAVAVTVITLLITVPLAITGYYAWAGYRWSRISGTIAAALSLGALTLNLYAWSAIPLAVVAAVLLWLPPASRYFLAWWVRRHPQQVFAPPTVDVFYGPLPRYRQD
ncbi:MAG: hypothetical protein CVT65_12550 [Actinobacteria bacterium HGW-Actinobacteria-5]|jgi:hypothetical protein|nr:MAG: hypothetical protein CVT65_12550 [Actinobacteria bacterium HGW-Actinobacteria-5]